MTTILIREKIDFITKTLKVIEDIMIKCEQNKKFEEYFPLKS